MTSERKHPKSPGLLNQVMFNRAGLQAGDGDLTFDGTTLTCADLVAGNLTIASGQTISGALTVSGLTVRNNAVVSGLTTTSGLTVQNVANISGLFVQVNATVTGLTTTSGLTVQNVANISGLAVQVNATVTGLTTTSGLTVQNLTTTSGLSVQVGATVTGLTTTSGLTVQNNATVNSLLTASGATVQNLLLTSGLAVQNNVTVTGLITTSGLTVQNNATVTGVVSAYGVTFPAAQVASADVNTLDDYEEGTWTPALTFGGGAVGLVYAVQSGAYTKIGRQVHVTAEIGLSAKGTSAGQALIGGLPFTSANRTFGGTISACGNVVFANGYLNVGVGPSASTIVLYNTPTSGAAVLIGDTSFTNTTTMRVDLIYYV